MRALRTAASQVRAEGLAVTSPAGKDYSLSCALYSAAECFLWQTLASLIIPGMHSSACKVHALHGMRVIICCMHAEPVVVSFMAISSTALAAGRCCIMMPLLRPRETKKCRCPARQPPSPLTSRIYRLYNRVILHAHNPCMGNCGCHFSKYMLPDVVHPFATCVYLLPTQGS